MGRAPRILRGFSMKLTTCHNCHRTTANARALGWVETSLASRGGRVAFLCPECAQHVGGYYDKNTTERGAYIGGGFSYGCEVETMRPTVNVRVEMADAGFIPTHDCTCDVEFKSPIFHNLKWCKRLDTWEKLLNAGEFNTRGCGTHLCVGHITAINEHTMTVLRNRAIWSALFGPLFNECLNDTAATRRVWGRSVNSWCDDTNPFAHECFVNVLHDTHLEFRCAKFASAAQYKALFVTCKGITARVVKFLDAGDYSEAAARKVGRSILRFYQKRAAAA